MENKEAAVAFAALGLEGRLDIVRMLLASPDGMRASDIVAALGRKRGEVPKQNSVSSMLKVLTQANVLTQERHGREIVYRVNGATLTDLGRLFID